MKICALALMCSFSYAYSGNNDRGYLSDGDFPLYKLPLDVQSDFIKILDGTIDSTWPLCLGSEPDYNKVEFLLYVNDTDISTKLNPTNPVGIDFSAPLFLLSHGWRSSVDGYKMKEFKDKYIQLHRKNIIFINWGEISDVYYITAFCNMPFIAQYVAQFLCDLSEKFQYDLKNVHMIGHSLGGQLSGLTGKATQKTCNKWMGKITALDPAGPLYNLYSEAHRLAPTDAEFVKIVHSNSGIFGYNGKCGTVDYHLNCGVVQPGCRDLSNLTDITKYTLSTLVCSHMRSVEIWPYVLESDQFKGKSCKNCTKLLSCAEDVDGADFVTMGHTNFTPPNEHYNVLTREYPPFHLGCKPYPSQGCT